MIIWLYDYLIFCLIIWSFQVRRRFVVADYLLSAIISVAFLVAFLVSTFQVKFRLKTNEKTKTKTKTKTNEKTKTKTKTKTAAYQWYYLHNLLDRFPRCFPCINFPDCFIAAEKDKVWLKGKNGKWEFGLWNILKGWWEVGTHFETF